MSLKFTFLAAFFEEKMSIVGGRIQLYFQFNKNFMGIASQKTKRNGSLEG